MTAKLKALKFGALAEHIAAALLRLKGYRILARQLRSPLGEIDIIARRGRTLAFIEVKARTTMTQAIEAVNFRQRGRIERAALAYTADHPNFAEFDLRFDLIAIAPWQMPRHLPNAWQT
ncbi:MAG: YraN family protein [Rhodospirillaceae bacterium]|jgi:putative endonuclease|nr:YraN family protein [Rhodospirillaceae bacterium]MBT7954297.1 YraN family protein [Rhodospirillaceae bacterium]